MEKMIVPIAGMHCRSCELLVEGNLAEIPEVKKSSVNYKRGTAEVYYSDQKPKMSEIEEAVRGAGYTVGTSGKLPWVSRHMSDWQDLGIAVLMLAFVYTAIQTFGIEGWNPIGNSGNPSSLGIVFLIGITAGLSTCLALVGGLVLGVAARHAESHPEASALQKFRPHLFFNFGRVVGYALLGGLLGWLGSFLQLSNGFLGGMTVVVSVVMLLLGTKLLGVFPKINAITFSLPKSISQTLGINRHKEKEYSHRNAFLLGSLTFFLPCGFTQAMQLYAVSSGHFVSGALIMGVFALGTTPGLLGVGGLASAVRGIFAKRFFVFSGLVVIAFAFFNLGNGSRLLGWNAALGERNQTQNAPSVAKSLDSAVTVSDGVQIVRMTESARGYTPNSFTVQRGLPVRWIIDAQAPYSCAGSIAMPSQNIRKNLTKGENIIEFTPTAVGTISFTCSMGMYRGTFEVVEQSADNVTSQQPKEKVAQVLPSAGGTCGAAAPSGVGGGCGGGKPVTPQTGNTEVVSDALNQKIQVLKATYTASQDVQPNTFTVKAGQNVRIEIVAEDDGYGCMGTVMVPGLFDAPQVLRQGKTLTMEFAAPTKKGEYPITCAMGVPHGKIIVQ
jgi:sulfite exporter TauE/SafE/plastocyanin domain-containing protein/copper chaperone CopZ